MSPGELWSQRAELMGALGWQHWVGRQSLEARFPDAFQPF
jgi:hypothetical protein